MGQLRVAKTKVRTGCRTCKYVLTIRPSPKSLVLFIFSARQILRVILTPLSSTHLTGTFRKRRVKCDEEKPECRRCVAGGRQCEGYEVMASRQATPNTQRTLLPGPRHESPQTVSSTSTRLPSPVSPLPGVSTDEIYYFDYFCKYTAPTLSGPFASPLFERFVLQLGHREPLIRHAATALAALQNAQDRNGRIVLNQEEAGFALTQYGKSLSIMRSTVISSETHEMQRLALVACILFVAFEIAQKRFEETTVHLEQGLNMLVNVRYRGQLPQGWDLDDLDTSDEGPGLDGELLRTFDRLDIQSASFRSTLPKLPSNPVEAIMKTPQRFHSLEQARDFLGAITRTLTAFQYEVRATLSPFSEADTRRLHDQQAEIRRQLQAWHMAFRHYKLPQFPLPTHSQPLSDVGTRACLEAMAISSSISLETGVSDGRECVFDSFLSEFELILDLAELSRDHPRSTVWPATKLNGGSGFQIHMACIPSVYVVALKCRDPHIRRRAISLLESFSFREGPWDGPMGARMMEHVCELEEFGHGEIMRAGDLPEKARVHEVFFALNDQEGGVKTSYKKRDFEGEYGEPGAWVRWTDRVHVQREALEAGH